VRVVISRGPAPVQLPAVVTESAGDAEHSLRSLGLRALTREVPAPGRAPGTVTAQRPAAGTAVPMQSTVTLDVAEVPRYRPLTTFSATGSSPLHIIGERWRIAYRMRFDGVCTWIFFCSGPTARVVNVATGATVARFGLSDGGEQYRSLATGPGEYEIRVQPGGDTASWSVGVEDLY
jgi:hypothetical protein